ncbi:MAG: hypothetical protein JRF40_07665, partial [Deltaproteobacteria bacterium]|nr:hypothetical protein [Deltaproteobacteria bacterium]
FKKKKEGGEHDLRVAAIFTYGANEDDPDAIGLLPDIDAYPTNLKNFGTIRKCWLWENSARKNIWIKNSSGL